MMQNLVGTTFQQYQILAKIRETATRILFKAYDTKAQRYTALEVVKGTHGDPSGLFERLNAQMQKNAGLEHPGIAVVTDTGIHEGIIYLVYGFVPTYPLRRFFNRTYSWQETARELVSITHALAYAHEKGIWHGFLNPASLVLDDKRNPILFDFGFEQIITDHIVANTPGAWVNRWGHEYQPPEQLSGGPTDRRADIYAIGMMIHEWLLGKLPLLDTTLLGTLQARKNMEPIRKKKRQERKQERTLLTPVVEQLIRKCIARNPAERYQSMQEVYIVLARGALDMTITKRMVRKPLAITDRRASIRRVLLALGTVAVLAVAGFAFAYRSNILASEPPADVATPTSSMPAPTTPATSTPRPTATPQTVDLLPATEAPRLNTASLPLFQGESLALIVNQPITPDNVDQMVMVSLWGIGEVNRVATSADGKYLAVASSIGVFVLDAQNLELVKYMDTRSWVTAIAFSPDSRAIASGDREGLIQLWHVDTWEEFETPFSGHKQSILDLAFSPDGTKLASVALDNTLIQWQVSPQDAPNPVRLTVSGATAVTYSSDGNRLITGGNDFKINVYDAANPALLQSITASAKIVDIASGGNRLVVGGADQRISILDLENATLTPVGSMQYPLTAVAFSPDGQYIAGGDINGGVAIWDQNPTPLWRSQNYVLGNSASITMPGSPHSLSFSPDGKLIFSGLQNGTLRALNTNTGEEVATNRTLNVRANKTVFSHDGKYALTQQGNNTLTMWEVWRATPLYQIQGSLKEGDAFSQNDRMFAIAADIDTVKIHESTSGRELYALNEHQDLSTIKFLNGDTHLAAGYDQWMHLWSLSSGQELKIKKAYAGRGCVTMNDWQDQPLFSITNFHYVIDRDQTTSVLCNFQKLNWTVAINDASEQIAYGGNSKLTVVTSGGETLEFAVNRKNIVSVALTPAGDVLAAAFDDHTIHLWNVNTREELFSLFGHDGLITGLRFTPDGKLLFSVSQDGTIRVWGVPN